MCSTAIHLRHRLRISDQSAIRLRNHLSASALSAGLSRWWFPRRTSATTHLSGASPRPLPCERWNLFSLPRPNSSAWCANCRWTHGTCPHRHRFRCATWSSTSWWEIASLRSCLPASVVNKPGTCSQMTSSETTRSLRWPNRHDTRPRPSPPHHRNSQFQARTATSLPRRSCGSGSSTLWDLLRAAGLDETLDPPVVAGLSRVVEPHLDDMLAFGAYGEGPSLSLPPDASQQTRLLGGFGRRP